MPLDYKDRSFGSLIIADRGGLSRCAVNYYLRIPLRASYPSAGNVTKYLPLHPAHFDLHRGGTALPHLLSRIML